MARHAFEPVGGEFPDTCRICACFRESATHVPGPNRVSVTAAAEYLYPGLPSDSVQAEIKAHMAAYGFRDIKVTVALAGGRD